MGSIKDLVRKIDRKDLKNNVQKVLYSLLLSEGWLARTSFRLPNAAARIRDLRKEKYGGFIIDCVDSKGIKKYRRSRASKLTEKQTYYRIDPKSITLDKVRKIFGKLI